MSNCRVLILTVTASIFLLTLAAPVCGATAEVGAAAEERAVPAVESESSAAIPEDSEEQGDAVTAVEEVVEPAEIETHTLVRGFTGYRFLSVDGYGGRATPYEYLHSGIVGGGMINSLGKDLKIAVEGVFNNEKDYHADLLFDYAGDYRFHLRSEALFHNMDHEQLFSPAFSLGTAYNPLDKDPSGRYGVKVQQDLASFRIKFHDQPIHFNLGYWRIQKDGLSQLRFADQSFGAGTNTSYSQQRNVNLQTHEGNIGFDAHLGVVDVIYNFKIRQFEDAGGILRDQFVARADRNAGMQEHSENPDSRFYSHTVKLHTSLSGGIVGAASYSYGKRDNLSRLTDVRGASESSATMHNAAGDFTYTPCKWFSAAMKYRRMEIDTTTPATITSSFAMTPSIDLRPNLGSQKDTVTVTFSIRPIDILTFKGEYKGEYLHREQVINSSTNSFRNWHLPENSATQRGSFTILSQPLRGLRLKALYGYTTTDHPSYGTSFEQKHEGQLLATYTSKKRWGVTGNFRSSKELNDNVERFTFASFSPLSYSAQPVLLSREKKTNNVTTSFWVSPLEKLTLSASFAFLHNNTDQAVLYSMMTPATQGLTNYTNQAQVWTMNSLYRFNEKVDLSLALQQVRSVAEFDPTLVTVNASNDTTGIKELSSIRTVENSVSTRAAYHLNKNVTCTVDYTYREYDEKNSSLFDGSVQTVVAYLTAKW